MLTLAQLDNTSVEAHVSHVPHNVPFAQHQTPVHPVAREPSSLEALVLELAQMDTTETAPRTNVHFVTPSAPSVLEETMTNVPLVATTWSSWEPLVNRSVKMALTRTRISVLNVLSLLPHVTPSLKSLNV